MNAGPALKCQTPEDIYLLLKASDFVSHDLSHAYDDCIDAQGVTASGTYELVLKKWFDMPRSQEFRCTVKENQLVGELSEAFSGMLSSD